MKKRRNFGVSFSSSFILLAGGLFGSSLLIAKMMKARFGKEVATLSAFQTEPLMAMVFLKEALKFLEGEEGHLMKGMQTMKTPIADVNMAQDKKDVQEVGVRGRCFANSSNHKNNCYGPSAQAEGSRVRGNSPKNSSVYTRHLHLIKSGLEQQRMMATKRERANGKSSRGKGPVLEDCFSGNSYSEMKTMEAAVKKLNMHLARS